MESSSKFLQDVFFTHTNNSVLVVQPIPITKLNNDLCTGPGIIWGAQSWAGGFAWKLGTPSSNGLSYFIKKCAGCEHPPFVDKQNHMDWHTYVHVYTCVYIYIYVCIYIYIYTNIYTYLYYSYASQYKPSGRGQAFWLEAGPSTQQVLKMTRQQQAPASAIWTSGRILPVYLWKMVMC